MTNKRYDEIVKSFIKDYENGKEKSIYFFIGSLESIMRYEKTTLTAKQFSCVINAIIHDSVWKLLRSGK